MLWAPWGPQLVISVLIAYKGRRRIGALGALGPSLGHFLLNGLSRKEENWCSGRPGALIGSSPQQLLNMKGGAGGLDFDHGRPRKLTCMELTLPTTYYLLTTTYYLIPTPPCFSPGPQFHLRSSQPPDAPLLGLTDVSVFGGTPASKK